MKRYFYLAASLPDLELETKPPILFSDFLLSASHDLTKEDQASVSILQEMIDIENIRRLLLEQDIDDRGQLSEKALDEAILTKVNLPDYAVDFLWEYTTLNARLEHFGALYAGFFAAHKNNKNRFLKEYLAFEHELRLWTSLLRAQRRGQDFASVLQFEDPAEPLIMSMLVQNTTADLKLPLDFKPLKEIFSHLTENPLTLHKKIEQFRLNKITELIQDEIFVIDNILGFMAKLLIVEQWQSLNYDRGMARLNHFLKKN